MRKTSPVFVVILLVVIGCGSSDEDESTLVGSWEIVSIGGQPLSTVASLFAFFLSLSSAFEAEGQIEGIESRVIKNDFVFAADGSYSSTVGFEWTVNKNNGASKYLDKIKSILFSAIVRSSISDLSGLSRLAVG